MIDHITDVGVYPKAVRGTGDGDYEERSDYQNGWNAATKDVIDRYVVCSRPGWKPEPDEEYQPNAPGDEPPSNT